MFTAYRIQPVVEYEGSDESRETERFSTVADAQKFWDAKVEEARCFEHDEPESLAIDCGLKLYWTLYGVHPEENGVCTDEAIADRETEEHCKALLLQIIGPYHSDADTTAAGWYWPLLKGLLVDEHAAHGDIVTITPLGDEPEPSDAAQMELLEMWFPWLGTDQDQSGADTIDRLVEWYEAVGGEFNPEDDNED